MNELRDILEQIADLEEEYNLLGSRIFVREGAQVDTLDAVRYVLQTTIIMIDLIKRKNDIPRA